MALFAPGGGAPTQSTVLPSDVEQREAHQKPVRFLSSAHPTRTRRAASRSKPPKTASGAKLAVYAGPGYLIHVGLLVKERSPYHQQFPV
nr:hypothetical protein [Methylomarinum sp. Ch1-1]MDP4519829.1 hypothetical protein [Methylomarinum sp. Ch1-1]